MATETTGGILYGLYRNHVGEPTTHDEVRGYWVFLTGLVLGTLGIALFVPSTSATGGGFSLRELSIALSAVGLSMLVAGPVIRLPLRSWANYAAYAGQTICFLAVVWFVVAFPGDWTVRTGNQPTIVLYALGLAVITVGGVIVPLIAAEMGTESTTGGDTAGVTAIGADTRDGPTDAERSAAELQGLVDSLRASKARFELYEDRGEEWRWRLRHRNGNTIATSGQGYTRRHNAQKGLESVRANALGANLLLVEREADLPAAEEAFEPLQEAESATTFEVYEDAGGEFRWRLRHDNGNVVADSAEGYSSRDGLRAAIDRVQAYAGPAEYLRIDPTAFEIYRDGVGEWRWRLVHENGNVLGDSGEGYSRRRDARRAVDRIRESVDDMTFEVYEDAAGEYRWRLTSNGRTVADSGEGYSTESDAEDAVEGVREYVPDAHALDIGWAAVEVYEGTDGDHYWRLRHRNGNVMADGSEGYASRSSAHQAVDRFKRNAPNGTIEVQS